jgi:hypothetical protein
VIPTEDLQVGDFFVANGGEDGVYLHKDIHWILCVSQRASGDRSVKAWRVGYRERDPLPVGRGVSWATVLEWIFEWEL